MFWPVRMSGWLYVIYDIWIVSATPLENHSSLDSECHGQEFYYIQNSVFVKVIKIEKKKTT